MKQNTLWAGLDVGSTTIKIAIIDPETKELLYSAYRRHGARQAEVAREILVEAHSRFSDRPFSVAVCGSGGRIIAKAIDAFYIQEVVANSLAIREFYADTKVAIELGGQDAKVVFFRKDEMTGQVMASDMRMNGSCAGGTGAFIDEVATLLKITTPEFNSYAERGTTVHPISGRCGVFAKTDIQPLLNQGVSKEDIALSTFHAIAKQTIGGLAQGMEITSPVIFEGGPLTFNPVLIDVFCERLGLGTRDVILPQHPEIIVAHGTALSIGIMFKDETCRYDREKAAIALTRPQADFSEAVDYAARPFFETEDERTAFYERHAGTEAAQHKMTEETPSELPVYIGIDAGSTTSKFILMDESENVVDSFYSNNNGDPLTIIKTGLTQMHRKYSEMGTRLKVLGVGTTGYGEKLFASAFKADYHTVETVAHAKAALKYIPGASFILDIGGQDMKAITISDGIVTGIVLNEACSAGCGSFIETYAKSLDIPVENISEMAFSSKSPARLGSRCTIFMNSSIITEQKNGKTPDDIMAGLCRSIIENVFTKVIRMSNLDLLGNKVVVQGGTFKNNAVLRAFELFSDKEVHRAPYPGEMGAIGIALLTKAHMAAKKETSSQFPGFEAVESFSYSKQTGFLCPFCSNNCNRTVITFNDGSSFITGNRCERGEILGDPKDTSVREKLKAASQHIDEVPDMMRRRKELLFADYDPRPVSPPKDMTIGLPRALEFWYSMPFWKALFTSLGFQVRLSRESNQTLYEQGLSYVPSDTACFPAKVAHGHVLDLVKKKVDRIFFPMMLRAKPENSQEESYFLCSVVQGYPLIIKESHNTEESDNIPIDYPAFHWYDDNARNEQLVDYFKATFGLPRDIVLSAINEADRAQQTFYSVLQQEGQATLDSLVREKKFGVLLACRPYHNDMLVNHDLSRYFTRKGIAVLTLDSIPGLLDIDLTNIRADKVINFHVRMFSAAIFAAEHPALELVQIVSFGCGHDAVLSDEVARIMKDIAGKDPLILKLDESDVPGPLNIRVTSFVETVMAKREGKPVQQTEKLTEPYPVRFEKAHRKTKAVLVPTLSPSFSIVCTSVFKKEGYKALTLPIADSRAIELGKKYVHNDMCFPAQLNIGEALAFLETYPDPEEIAVGLAHEECDCRLAHYATVARKALDDAGYEKVPIVTTGKDKKGMHPGFKLGPSFSYRMLHGILICDFIDAMARRLRPYEKNPGEVEELHMEMIRRVAKGFETSIGKAIEVFEEAVEAFNRIEILNIPRKPRVFVIGEILLNYHPASNAYIESYLEANGMEVIMPPMIDAFKKETVTVKESMNRFHVKFPFAFALENIITDFMIDLKLDKLEKRFMKFHKFEQKEKYHDLAKHIDGLVDKAFNSGKGWLIPADIIEYAHKGVNSFIILQPFGCLPNHITGRGLVKTVKKRFPHIQVLSLDFDPDTSLANIENRLQMLIINAKEMEKGSALPEEVAIHK